MTGIPLNKQITIKKNAFWANERKLAPLAKYVPKDSFNKQEQHIWYTIRSLNFKISFCNPFLEYKRDISICDISRLMLYFMHK